MKSWHFQFYANNNNDANNIIIIIIIIIFIEIRIHSTICKIIKYRLLVNRLAANLVTSESSPKGSMLIWPKKNIE